MSHIWYWHRISLIDETGLSKSPRLSHWFVLLKVTLPCAFASGLSDAMVLPLSVGDCIAIIGVVIQGYNAISSTSDEAKELGSLQDDLHHMQDILEQLPKPDPDLASISEASIRKLNDTVSRCQTTLSELAAATKKYGPSKFTFVTYYRRVAWTFSGKMKVLPFEARIKRLTTALSLVQSDINRFVLAFVIVNPT